MKFFFRIFSQDSIEKSVFYRMDHSNFSKSFKREGNFGKKKKISWTKWSNEKQRKTRRRYIAIEHQRSCSCQWLLMLDEDYFQITQENSLSLDFRSRYRSSWGFYFLISITNSWYRYKRKQTSIRFSFPIVVISFSKPIWILKWTYNL